MKRMKRIYKERRLYFSQACERCGKRYQSFKRKRIKEGLCRKCRRINPDQTSLFDDVSVQSITSTHIDGDQQVTTVIGKQEDGTFGIKQSISPIECTSSPTGKHEYDPEDKMCIYCGKEE